MNTKLSLFEETNIRKIYKNNKWYYSLNDFISYYIGVSNPTEYINKLKNKDKYLSDNWCTLTINLNMKSKDNKIRKTLCTDNIGILRIIENIISPKLDDFKVWLARLGEEKNQLILANTYAAARALDSNIYAAFTDGIHRVSFDKVVQVMKQTGHDLPSLYKETSTGGLAKDYKQME